MIKGYIHIVYYYIETCIVEHEQDITLEYINSTCNYLNCYFHLVYNVQLSLNHFSYVEDK